MPPTIGISRAELVNRAKAVTAPPSAIETVSPINTLAGLTLNHIKPIQAPRVAAANWLISTFCTTIKANIVKNNATIAVIPDASPSSPSVRLTAFTVPRTTIIINGI